MDEKFMKVLREQQEIQQKAARILHDTEKMKEEVQNKLESLKRKVENDFKNIGEFLKEANVQFATYEYIFQEDDCKRIQINEQKYQTCIYVVVNKHKIYLGPSKAEDESCFHFSYKTGICIQLRNNERQYQRCSLLSPEVFARMGSGYHSGNCLRAVVKRHDEICDWKSNNYYIQYHRHLGPFHACITKNP